MEVTHKGADVSGRVLLRVLPLALPDVIDVSPQALRPVKVPGIIDRIDLACGTCTTQIPEGLAP